MTIGQRIKNLRKKKGVSGTKFGQEMGVGKATISHWESDRHSPSLNDVIFMANYFEITPGELAFGDATSNQENRNQIIAGNIKNLLLQNNMSQVELARRLDMSKGTISDYLAHKSAPSDKVISKMTEIFEVSKNEIDTTYATSCTSHKLFTTDIRIVSENFEILNGFINEALVCEDEEAFDKWFSVLKEYHEILKERGMYECTK